LPSADSATDQPNCGHTDKLDCEHPAASSAVSFCRWVHVPTLRVKTHAAPAPLLSNGAPIMAVLPSAETATEKPCLSALPTGSLAVSFGTFACLKSAIAGSVKHSSAAHTEAGGQSRDMRHAADLASATECGQSARSAKFILPSARPDSRLDRLENRKNIIAQLHGLLL
jgi:hypothetical protein